MVESSNKSDLKPLSDRSLSAGQKPVAAEPELPQEKSGATNSDRLARLGELLQNDPRNLDALVEKGALLHRLGRASEALELFADARQIAPDDELITQNFAAAMAECGRLEESLRELRRVAANNPSNLSVRHQIRRLTSAIIPFWHIRMLNDIRRNDAFEQAIQKAIAKEGASAKVLDIGAGSGLLSMMAARAGATKVVACEKAPLIAEMAERIVELNGFQDRIRVINKASTDLIVEDDLQGRADILISEVLSSDLLAEGVFNTFEDANRRLIRRGATVIPRSMTAVGCLVSSDVLRQYAYVGHVSGFDLSPFGELSPQRLPVHGVMTSWRRLSEDFEILTIDLTLRRHEPATRKLSVPVLEDGVAAGVIQWIQLDLAEHVVFSNHPDSYFEGSWLQILHTFPQELSLTKGQRLELNVGHDRSSLVLQPARAASD
jgi:predicted RNA methylase